MSCNKTQHLLQEYFSEDLSSLTREKIEEHFFLCEECSEELESALAAQSNLTKWREQRVPHWDRGSELFRRENRAPIQFFGLLAKLQWFPVAASFLMLTVLLLNTQVVSNDEGFLISFGVSDPNTPDIESQLQVFYESQRQDLNATIQRLEERQDNNNIELLRAVVAQTQQTTAENLDSMYAFFDQQRLLDLEDMRVGYQELVDSDYETIRSLQQLAQFVSYQGEVR